jgi:hypothetical protein
MIRSIMDDDDIGKVLCDESTVIGTDSAVRSQVWRIIGVRPAS